MPLIGISQTEPESKYIDNLYKEFHEKSDNKTLVYGAVMTHNSFN